MSPDLNSEQVAQFFLSYLKDYIRIMGISQKDLASKVGIDPVYLSRILSGLSLPTLDTFVSILDSLDLSVSLHRGKLYPYIIF